MEKLKALWAALTDNPVKFIKNLCLSLDHSDRGFSLKKIIFVYMVVIIITALYAAYIYFRLKKGEFGEFLVVLPMTLTWAGYLIKLNATQEKDIMNLKNNIPSSNTTTPKQ